MIDIAQNLAQLNQKIVTAAQHCQRDPKQITLVAVSKTKPVSAIEAAIAAGQYQFGENYVQEGVDKVDYFQQLSTQVPLIWHFIGPLQSNKTRTVAEHFDWIHTVDRLKIAERLSAQRPATKAPLNVLIQINISQEQSKSGIMAEQLFALAAQIAPLPQLKLRGLMAIPAPESAPAQQLAVFKQMQLLFSQLKQIYPDVDTLSMGMSDDMASAIAAGSTLVRIGSTIFGARDYPR
ncbi:YggS family pyridoxal phosphate-dependent enzyme [Utexia brackfieldae]|uniref:YggS family pyridoxal phosphate-dependent enzyme n=1 Tax=Utexia brackfieldae TaxID=3074108 RepID=UPI00370D9096